ncbi:hypothetical protein [Providencia hangzhouensis]|uniref:hypothetical protein n=1 Tax=Providencia hangzhouensis TaxID=3031799 RepID=UPI0034DD9CD1
MSDKLISPKVGCATQTCDIPEPCYLDLLVKDTSKDKVILEWRGEDVISPEIVIDEGEGVPLEILLNDKKHNNAQHNAILTSKNYEQALSLGSSQSVSVSYNASRDAGTFSASNLLNTFVNMLAPIDAFKSPRRYNITATNCLGTKQDWTFDVIPSVKFGFSVNFSYSFQTREANDKERRDKQISKLKSERLKGGPGENTLPKKLNKYHKGWTLAPIPFVKTTSLGIDVGFFYELAGHPYNLTPIKQISETKTFLDDLSGILKVSQIINDIETKLLYQQKGKLTPFADKYPIFSFDFSDIEIGLTFFMENVTQRDSARLVCALEGKPFWGGSFNIDVLQVLALYGGKAFSSGISKLREALEERKKGKDKFSAGINIDITFSFAVHCFVGMAQTPDKQQEFAFDGDNKFEIGFKADAGAYIKANVLFLEACFEFHLRFETKGALALDAHDDGIDLVLCHDGIVLKFQFTADISLRTKKDDSAFYEGAPLDADWTIYQFADPLTPTESDIRFNLAGQVRKVPERQRPELAAFTSAVNAVPTSIAGTAIKNTFEKG